MFLWKLAPIIGTQADLQENHAAGALSINNKLLTHVYWVQSIPSKQSFNDIPHAGELWVNMHGNCLSAIQMTEELWAPDLHHTWKNNEHHG